MKSLVKMAFSSKFYLFNLCVVLVIILYIQPTFLQHIFYTCQAITPMDILRYF